MAKQPPWLLITTSTQHNVARVKRGPRGERDLYGLLCRLCEVAGTVPPQRSMAGGFVVSLSVVSDLRAYARTVGEWVLVREHQP